MKKRNLHTRLYLKKHTIAFLDAKLIKGGTRVSDDCPTTVDNSLGKQSTCPIETCTCDDPKPVPTRL